MTALVHPPQTRHWGAFAAPLVVLVVGAADWLTGTEVRLYPFYFVAFLVAGPHLTHRLIWLLSLMSAAAWVLANWASGQAYSHPAIWVVNALTQSGTSLLVGTLFMRLQRRVRAEHYLARVDDLTGLHNQRGFREVADRLWQRARQDRAPFALAYVDLDDFKMVNDRLGHTAGDRLLRRVAQTISLSVRVSDRVARIGGDEFVLLLPNTTEEEALTVLERVRRKVKAAAEEEKTSVTASVGLAVCDEADGEFEPWLETADAALYRAKAEGKNHLKVERVRAAKGAPAAGVDAALAR